MCICAINRNEGQSSNDSALCSNANVKSNQICIIIKSLTLMRGDANYNLQILIISIKIYSCLLLLHIFVLLSHYVCVICWAFVIDLYAVGSFSSCIDIYLAYCRLLCRHNLSVKTHYT